MDAEGEHIGRRVREVRAWRGVSLTAAAGLAGISAPYLSMIERGQRPVTKRATLEALARALQVSPSELTGRPYAPPDAQSSDMNTALLVMENALECYELGIDPNVPVRPWPEIKSDIERVRDLRHVSADYAALGLLVPDVMAELHSVCMSSIRVIATTHCWGLFIATTPPVLPRIGLVDVVCHFWLRVWRNNAHSNWVCPNGLDTPHSCVPPPLANSAGRDSTRGALLPLMSYVDSLTISM